MLLFFQPIRELEFLDRFIDIFLSSKNANNCYICKQLSLLCETLTYFRYIYISIYVNDVLSAWQLLGKSIMKLRGHAVASLERVLGFGHTLKIFKMVWNWTYRYYASTSFILSKSKNQKSSLKFLMKPLLYVWHIAQLSQLNVYP